MFPDGRRVVSCDGYVFRSRFEGPGVLKVWDVTTGKETRKLEGHTGSVRSCAFSPDGTTIVQSIAIANWAAKKAGMYPTDGDKAGLVDMVMLCSEEALSGAPQAGNSPETLKQRREEFANGALRKLMGVMNDNLKGPFLLGDELCVADLGIYGNVDMIAGGRLDHVPGDYVAKNFPKLVEHYEAVKQHPTLKAYWAAYKN